MIEAVDQILEGIQELDLEKLALEAAAELTEEILQLNKDQLQNGRNANGVMITPLYSERYARYKASRGLQADRVDLRLEGDFQDSFVIEFGSTEFTIKATDFKEVYLTRRYGEEILGLSPNSLEILRELIAPKIKSKIEEKLLLL